MYFQSQCSDLEGSSKSTADIDSTWHMSQRQHDTEEGCWTRAVWLGWRWAQEASFMSFYVVTSLCNECKRRGRREFLWALETGEQKHQDGSQVQLVLESFPQSLELGKELSILPPTYVPAGAPFPCCLTATRGCQQHERMPCRNTWTASLGLFLGTRSSIAALA